MSTPSETTSFARQAAKLSWVCPIIVFALLAFGWHIGSRVMVELVALALIVTGILAGLIALFGIPRHGVKGILAPALAGIIINALLFFIFATNFLAARARARHASVERSPVVAAEAVGGRRHGLDD